MNWYKNIIAVKENSIVDLIYDEWKKNSFKENVNIIIYRIYKIDMSENLKEDKIEKRVSEVVSQLSSEEGDLQLWHRVLRDKKYLSKIKKVVKKNYNKKIKELKQIQKGPLQINTPQTPSSPSGGSGGGGLLM